MLGGKKRGLCVSTSIDPLIGAELAGYHIEALVGRGGMGVVYRGRDARLKRNVALKLVAPELAQDEALRARLLRESELAASLDHPNVIPIYEAGTADGRLFLAMRFVDGGDLRGLLETEAPLAPERAVAICGQVADALDAAHARGLVHKDVKPSNVLLDGNEHVYLADFGLTRELAEQGAAGAGRSVGTPAYSPPEQIRGGAVSGSADVYALGCVLFECLTGQPPFAGERNLALLFAHLEKQPPNASARNPRLPMAIDPVLRRALAKDPDERHASCRELVEEARVALGLRAVPVRGRTPLLLVAAGLLLALAAALVALLLVWRDDGRARPSTSPTAAPGVDALQRIDPETNELVATFRLGSDATGVAVGERAVWVISLDDNRVAKIDPATNDVVATGSSPGPDAIAVGGGSVWVLNGSTISELDPATASHVGEVLLEDGGELIAFGSGALWVADPLSGVLARINPRSGSTVATLDLADQIGLLEQLAAGEGAVWVSTSNVLAGDFGLLQIDPRTNREPGRIRLRGGAAGVAAGEGAVWVANTLRGTVSQIDPSTNRLLRTLPVGDGPIGVAAGEGAVWVTNHREGTVTRIDPASGRVVATIEVGPNPDHVAAGEGGVWVTVHAR
jgi:YVTN family beta-propeller protein